jgi:hypothetical protein
MAFREEHCLPAAERGPVECSLYEPALFMNRAIPAEVSTRLEAELAEGRIAAALITAMRGAQMGPAALRALPRPLLEFLAEMAMNGEDKQTGSNYVPMKALAATLRFDSQLAVEMSGKLEDFQKRPCRHTVTVREEEPAIPLGGSRRPTAGTAASVRHRPSRTRS